MQITSQNKKLIIWKKQTESYIVYKYKTFKVTKAYKKEHIEEMALARKTQLQKDTGPSQVLMNLM